MTKGQIYFSNSLEELVERLKENLFSPNGAPFNERLIAVPHLRLKSFIQEKIAKDPTLQVAAGLKIVNLSQAWGEVMHAPIPTGAELSLWIQHTLRPLIGKDPDLKVYFSGVKREKRIAPFCDQLAEYFHSYGLYGKKEGRGWQEILWKKALEKWVFPKGSTGKKRETPLHLFGFSYLPPAYFEFFQQVGANYYLFSPCEIFWEDFYSKKELKSLKKNVPERQLDLFESTFEGQNPLLANWGKLGRRMGQMVEESVFITQECYQMPKEGGALSQLQSDCLGGTHSSFMPDASILCQSATHPQREIEILKDYLIKQMEEEGVEPKEIEVLSPDISRYAPYIRAVFSDLPYQISNLAFTQTDQVVKAFAFLVQLPKKRFASEEVFQFFSLPPLQKKFELPLEKIGQWVEKGQIKWGFSKAQRKAFYVQEIDEQEVKINTEQGTFEKGLRRLLLGLGELEGDEAPLPLIEVTEIETFNQFYSLLYSLADDLSPFFDGTRWTLSTWFRYFSTLLECYFPIDPSHELYKEFQELASKCDPLDQEEVPFSGVETILSQTLNQKTKMEGSSHLQSLHFTSLSEGAILPAKVICFIGMEEEAFPRKEERGSLFVGDIEERPNRGEVDRYLFLQGLLSAKKALYISYVRDLEKKGGIPPLIQDLNQPVVHHPSQPFDRRYFQGELISYNERAFEIAKGKEQDIPSPPLIPSFFQQITLESPSKESREIEIHKLFKFAKHPLRYYLNEVLGVYPAFSPSNTSEYLLSPLLKGELVKQALITPLEEVLEKAEKRGELPVNLLLPLAKEQLVKEVALWEEGMDYFGLSIHTLKKEKISLQVGPYTVKGTLEIFPEKGTLIKGKGTFEDQICFYPQALILQNLGLSLFPLQGKEPLQVEGDLEAYLDYFVLASITPSPLLPDLAKPLLHETERELEKEMKKLEDETWGWLLFRDGFPDAKAIHRNWSHYLRERFYHFEKV